MILNAPAQAKQHYEGKNHARRLKMYLDNQEELLKKEQQPPEQVPAPLPASPPHASSPISTAPVHYNAASCSHDLEP